MEIGWLEAGDQNGAVSHDTAVLFLRNTAPPFQPVVVWVFSEHLDACHLELKTLGANIIDALQRKPWGLRQFTVCDPDGNLF